MSNFRTMLVILVSTFVSGVFAGHQAPESIEKRTAPTGMVYKVSDEQAVVQVVTQKTASNRNGEAVFSAKCAMCHGEGIAGAPKSGDSSAWQDRISQGESVLVEHAINGFQGKAGFMPAKGGCTDCSDSEIKAAVVYMLDMLK